MAVVVGRNGLAWTPDFATKIAEAPVKHEGDGRSPAGVFSIGAAFGYEQNRPAWIKVAYIPLTPATECVDDERSRYYNAIVDRIASQAPDWNSSEKMRQVPEYKYGLIVNYNVSRVRGAGSCIFLHIRNAAGQPTAGCTAMDETNLIDLLKWLDESAHPVLAVFPQHEYDRVRNAIRLP